LIGIEIGVDVGSHAEAMLTYCNIEMLYLVDVWKREYYKGYCEGRLHTKGFMHKTKMIHHDSANAAKIFAPDHKEYFDFMYFDQLHDYISVSNDLKLWWPLLKKGGVLGYRNYAESNTDLKHAVDEFISKMGCTSSIERGEIVIFKGK